MAKASRDKGRNIIRQEQSSLNFKTAVDDQFSRQSVARFLRFASSILLVGACASLVVQRRVAPDQLQRSVGPALIILMAFTALYLLSRRKLQAALLTLVFGSWAVVTVTIAVTNGVHAPMGSAFSLLILVTGWLIGPGTALVMTGLAITLTFGLAFSELSGLLTLLPATPPLLSAATQSIVYTISVLVVVFAVRINETRLKELRRIAHELAQRTQELEINKAEMAAAQVVAKVGSWVYDFGSDLLQLSAETCRIFGVPPGTTGSLDASATHVHPDDWMSLQRAWQRALKGEAFDVEYRIVLGEETHWIHSKAEIICAAGGAPKSAVGTAQDITERRQHEVALVEAKAEADRANKAKSTFLAAVSHDLGQPLSALTLLVSVLKQTAPPASRRLVQNMQDCVDGMSGLLNDLMKISKLNAGVFSPTLSDFSINDLMASLISMHSTEAQHKGLSLRFRARHPDTFFYTDLKLLQRVLGNLISNAIRYTHQGGILVACRTHAGKHWVEVWDTGIGIPPEKTDLVFGEFTQLDGNTAAPGNGLGLSIVSKTTQLLGLQVRLQSRVGRGSLFAVELPSGRARPAAYAAEAQARARPSRIGLVDDNAMLLESLVFALEAANYEVIAASTAKSLLAQLDGQAPDIVISDYCLAAGETGLDVIEAVHHTFGNQLPCLIMTADTEPALRAKLQEKHVPLIYKPLDINTFLTFIKEATERRQTDEGAWRLAKPNL